jgi:hypothetical protein
MNASDSLTPITAEIAKLSGDEKHQLKKWLDRYIIEERRGLFSNYQQTLLSMKREPAQTDLAVFNSELED